MIKRRIQNVKGYHKCKSSKNENPKEGKDSKLSEKEIDELHSQLLKEVRSRHRNFQSIKEIQRATFHNRADSILAIEGDVISQINSCFPFFKDHDCVVSILLVKFNF